MKDYKKIAKQIKKLGSFCDIHNCGTATKSCPVNLYFELSEPYVIGYGFYVSYMFHEWIIDYTLDNSLQTRANMQTVRGIKTDKDMYNEVEQIIKKIRRKCELKG